MTNRLRGSLALAAMCGLVFASVAVMSRSAKPTDVDAATRASDRCNQYHGDWHEVNYADGLSVCLRESWGEPSIDVIAGRVGERRVVAFASGMTVAPMLQLSSLDYRPLKKERVDLDFSILDLDASDEAIAELFKYDQEAIVERIRFNGAQFIKVARKTRVAGERKQYYGYYHSGLILSGQAWNLSLVGARTDRVDMEVFLQSARFEK